MNINPPMHAIVHMESKGVYQIVVQGKIPPDWCDRLGGMRLTRYREESPEVYISVLTGELTDQAALIGIINFLYDIGFPLLAVRRLSD